MKFSKYKYLFFACSFLLTVVFFVVTFSIYGGFAHSITFDGGIRFSMLVPPEIGKVDMEKALQKTELKDYQIRLVNLKTNQYDVEFGPSMQSVMEEKIAAEKKSSSADDLSGDKKTVIGELEAIILRSFPFAGEKNIVSREAISASYGGNLARVALSSLLWVIGMIGIYLSFRFDLPFAVGASVALLHDVILSIGFIGIMQIEPSIPVVAAVLTIIGYSINDTIVIFDRIRENSESRSSATIENVMDMAITQTLSRTIITSLLTLLSVLALLFGGAESLRDFSLVLIFGIVIGTYSSIFIASHFVQVYEKLRLLRKRA